MFIERMTERLLDYSIGNKIGEDGFPTLEKDENYKFTFPPKKREEYATEEEYNKANEDYLKFKEYCQKYVGSMKTLLEPTFNTPGNKLLSKSRIRSAIKSDNKKRIAAGVPEEVARTDIDISSSELKERKLAQKEAQETIEDKIGIQLLGCEMIKQYCRNRGIGQYSRPSGNMFSLDVETLDDLFRDFNILINGTPEEKTKMFQRKYNKAKEVAFDLCEQKSPKEFTEYCKKNFLTVNVLSEMQASNMPSLEKDWDLKIDEKTSNDIKENYNFFVTAGGQNRAIGVIANPYYTVIKQNCHTAGETLVPADGKNAADLDTDLEMDRMLEHEQNEIAEAENPDDIKDGKPLAKLLSNYFVDQTFEKAGKNVPQDLLCLYFMKNKDTFTKIKDENGRVTEGDPKILAKAAADQVKNNKAVLVYDRLGNFKTKINIPDYDMCDVPETYGKLKTIDFRFANTADQIKELKKEVNGLEGYFSQDHQEFKDIRSFVNKMGDAYKNGTSLATLCGELRKLAVKYVESKYTKDTPEKTPRTYKREEFMCRLIGSIDQKYPIHYPLEIKKQTIKDLATADLKNDKLLNDVIRMNKEGYNREEVEEHAQTMIYSNEKTRVEVNLGEDRKENANDVFVKEEDKKENLLEEKVEGMSEKDI